jgi:heme-degrading monooxygenase HmoA
MTMITIVVLHVIAEENRDAALALIERNGADARKFPGFVSRRMLFSRDDPLRCYSVTSWRSWEDVERFRTRTDRPPLDIEGEERRIYEWSPAGRILLFTRSATEICDEAE